MMSTEYDLVDVERCFCCRDLIPLFLNQAIILVVLIFMEFVVITKSVCLGSIE